MPAILWKKAANTTICLQFQCEISNTHSFDAAAALAESCISYESSWRAEYNGTVYSWPHPIVLWLATENFFADIMELSVTRKRQNVRTWNLIFQTRHDVLHTRACSE